MLQKLILITTLVKRAITMPKYQNGQEYIRIMTNSLIYQQSLTMELVTQRPHF